MEFLAIHNTRIEAVGDAVHIHYDKLIIRKASADGVNLEEEVFIMLNRK